MHNRRENGQNIYVTVAMLPLTGQHYARVCPLRSNNE